MRMYDPRVGRFFSADPLMFMYPYLTPYQFAENMPITSIDLDGLEAANANGSGPQKLPNGRYEGDSNGSTKKSGALIGSKLGSVVHKASPKIHSATANNSSQSQAVEPYQHIPSIDVTQVPVSEVPLTVNTVPVLLTEFQRGKDEAFVGAFVDMGWGIITGGRPYFYDPAKERQMNLATNAALLKGIKDYWGLLLPPISNGYQKSNTLLENNITDWTMNATAHDLGSLAGGAQAAMSMFVIGRYFPSFGAAAEEGIVGAEMNAAKSGTTGYRYMSQAELKAIQETGYLRGGWSGETYFTKDLFKSSLKAKSRLALDKAPSYRVEFEILNNPTLLRNGTKVKAFNGQMGGGSEFMTLDPVKVRLINWQPLK